ncbi:hypothetical protein BY458DRAFT_546988 [Sporodiniella umbellata]|nr:hypothetical protein BY458DRAFT_546988 [Sporodiniella umbellata]
MRQRKMALLTGSEGYTVGSNRLIKRGMSAVPGIDVATMAIEGAAVYVGSELAIRSILPKKTNSLLIQSLKFILGLSIAVKSALFLTFFASIGSHCQVIARVADAIYHVSMAAGTGVMLARVYAIIPIPWKKLAFFGHVLAVCIRFAIGAVDVAVVTVANHEANTCKYKNVKFWGPVYTLYDATLDIYVTAIITVILVSHIRSLALGSMRISITLYTSVIYNNVIRTVLLTIVNCISAAFNFTGDSNNYIMTVWPITNIGFVLLVGYDSDITKTIQNLRHSPEFSLNEIESRHSPSKPRPLSREVLNDPENLRLDSSSEHSSTLYMERHTTGEFKEPKS